jgi:predicted ArsR family transcriptional regulator
MTGTPDPGNAGPGTQSPAPARAGLAAGARDLTAVAALAEPARRALYAYVAAQGRPVSRDEAAGATGLKRATAAFHLDRLAEDGLLEVAFARRPGRAGPGAGRTAKLYARSSRQIAVSLPPRRYELAADVLACAVEESLRTRAPVGETLAQAAGRAGRELAAGASGLAGVLHRAGYEPRAAGGGRIELANCPFHPLAGRHPALVCELNLSLLRGLLAGLGVPGQARLQPSPGRCCVTISTR